MKNIPSVPPIPDQVPDPAKAINTILEFTRSELRGFIRQLSSRQKIYRKILDEERKAINAKLITYALDLLTKKTLQYSQNLKTLSDKGKASELMGTPNDKIEIIADYLVARTSAFLSHDPIFSDELMRIRNVVEEAAKRIDGLDEILRVYRFYLDYDSNNLRLAIEKGLVNSKAELLVGLLDKLPDFIMLMNQSGGKEY